MSPPKFGFVAGASEVVVRECRRSRRPLLHARLARHVPGTKGLATSRSPELCRGGRQEPETPHPAQCHQGVGLCSVLGKRIKHARPHRDKHGMTPPHTAKVSLNV